jgi:transcriptional regulator with XRE-family HTH domain
MAIIIIICEGDVIMTKARTYSKYSVEAITLLGKQIKLGRKQSKWTEHELADRAGISRATLQKIEKGSFTCAIGLVFEVAMLAGVKLFDTEKGSLAMHLEMTNDKIALLPKAVHKNRKDVDDDF